jgi:uncharacterized protein YndB with AHSA1/START domain
MRSAEDSSSERRRLSERRLDRLGEYLARLPRSGSPQADSQDRARGAAMTARSVRHATFAIERCYPAVPRRVFSAWADSEARQIWMDDPDFTSDGTAYELDFRVGGHERFGGLGPQGSTYRCEALIYDIVPDQRIVYSGEVYEGDARISVSLTTVEIGPHEDGARLTYTEQRAFLDDLDTPAAREGGWHVTLDNLGDYLSAHASGRARR